MLNFSERPKTPGITFKKNLAFSERNIRNQLFAGDFVLSWMKQTLIWFNLERDGTGTGLSNIKDTLAETHIFLPLSLPFYFGLNKIGNEVFSK